MFEVWSLRVVDGEADTRKVEFVGAFKKKAVQCGGETAVGFKGVEQMLVTGIEWFPVLGMLDRVYVMLD